MTPRPIPRTIRLPRGCGIALCVLVAAAAAWVSVAGLSLKAGRLDVAGASTLVVVDGPRPLVSDALATSGDFQTLRKRTVLLGSLMTSPPALRHIARRAGIAPESIAAVTRVTANVQASLTEPGSERRASDIRDAGLRYRLEVQPNPGLQVLDVYTQAPTVAEAERLANASVPGLLDYERELAAREGARSRPALHVEQVGPARGAVINGGDTAWIATLTFLFALAVSGALLAVVSRARSRRARARAGPHGGEGAPTAVAAPEAPPRGSGSAAAAPPRASGSAAAPSPPGGSASAAADWPHTTRLLPWLVAVMMAVVWLVPFNVIKLSASLPIDLTFDRLILPLLIGVWVLALAAGGPYAPRIRMTWIHVAVLAMMAFACLSLVLGAQHLVQTLELVTSVKKLFLLASYVSLFFIVASVVRPSETHAFMSYTLILATLCALGTVWEYRFEYNVFYSLSDQLLPGIFQVGAAESAARDAIGRRIVRGPAELPLETVAMIAIGLPIALVRLIGATATRKRVVYGLSAALMIAAAVATYRKSAFIAPVAGILTLAYFRRRELLRLAPLGVVVAIMIPILSPGALQAVAAQLTGERLDVATVSDRTSDYDAVRPDVWTHLAFGRGYGSYEHTSYRILDMELLRQVVEVGVLGLAAFLFMIATIVAVARRPIRARGPTDAPVALAAAAAAVGFVVASTLFDIMSFPHSPYLLLFMAGLLAAVAAAPERRDAREEVSWSS